MKIPRLWSRLLLGAVFAIVVANWAAVNAQTGRPVLRVGVYDSRAVAVAYYNSPSSRTNLDAIQAEFKQAKARKDTKKIKEIEAAMKLRQRRNHEQGFSTGSVAAIMEQVKEALPAVATSAKVDLIVSKWEISCRMPNVEIVDITEQLVPLFHPNDRGAKWAKEIQSTPPVPLEKITDDID